MMQYQSTEKKTEEEIIDQLSNTKDDATIVSLVLSAIYFCSTKFAGNLLLYCLKNMTGENRIYLIINILSYMQIHTTNYLYKDFLLEIKKKYSSTIENQIIIDDTVEGILEFNEMFKDKNNSR